MNNTLNFNTSKAFAILLGLSLGISGCGTQANTQTSVSSQVTPQTVPPAQTEQAAIQPNQNSLTRLKIAFPSRKDSTDLQRKADTVAKFLASDLGIPVEAIVSDETAAVEALKADRVDVAFLSTRPALKAEQLANSKLYLAEVRNNYSGGYTYKSIIVVPKDSPLQPKDNPKETLAQLQGKKMTFTSPSSGSGFIFPVGELVKLGLVPNRDSLNKFFSQVSYGDGYSGALKAVLRGQSDVAAVSEYALNTPYITEEEVKQLRVLHAIEGVPAHGVVIDDDVPTQMREKIINAMLKLNQPENNQMLRELYNSTELVKVDGDKHLQPMRTALKDAGMEP